MQFVFSNFETLASL